MQSVEFGQVGNRVDLRWEPPNDASTLIGYTLNVASTDDGESFEYSIPAGETTYEVGGLTVGKEYILTLTPISNTGPGESEDIYIRPIDVLVAPSKPDFINIIPNFDGCCVHNN